MKFRDSFYYRTFNPTSPCESVHTEQKRYIFQEVDKEFWMVIVSVNLQV